MLIVRRTLLGIALVLVTVACGGRPPAPRADTVAGAAATSTTTERAAQARRFAFSAARLGPATRARVSGSSWHAGCPVGLDDLRLLRIGYRGFDGRDHVGKLIVAANAVPAMQRAFGMLFRARFPIRRMRLVDDYGASDFRSIDADNTSAFNCRPATGSTRFSEHAYGRAVDINPIENPYVYPNGTTVHAASRPFLDRSRHRPGMSFRGGVLVRAFAGAGWGWGGNWRPPSATDYQHFSATGR